MELQVFEVYYSMNHHQIRLYALSKQNGNHIKLPKLLTQKVNPDIFSSFYKSSSYLATTLQWR